MSIALVGASDFNGEAFLEHWNAGDYDEVIAVDGGFAHLTGVGCVPDAVVGDFDSLGYEPDGDDVRRFPAEKDQSDMELALAMVQASAAKAVDVYGGLGGRLDHTLGNLQLLASAAEFGLAVRAIGCRETVYLLVGPGVLELPTRETGWLSVFSLTDESSGVNERGLKYGLDDATLTSRTTWGLSNEFCGQSATISVEQGTLGIFLCR